MMLRFATRNIYYFNSRIVSFLKGTFMCISGGQRRVNGGFSFPTQNEWMRLGLSFFFFFN